MTDQRHHFRNVVALWLLANAIMLPVVIWVLGPGLPPGNGTVESSGQVTDNIVLLATATPVALGVLVYFAYALWAFRERDSEAVVDGAPIRGNSSVQFWWLITTRRRRSRQRPNISPARAASCWCGWMPACSATG